MGFSDIRLLYWYEIGNFCDLLHFYFCSWDAPGRVFFLVAWIISCSSEQTSIQSSHPRLCLFQVDLFFVPFFRWKFLFIFFIRTHFCLRSSLMKLLSCFCWHQTFSKREPTWNLPHFIYKTRSKLKVRHSVNLFATYRSKSSGKLSQQFQEDRNFVYKVEQFRKDACVWTHCTNFILNCLNFSSMTIIQRKNQWLISQAWCTCFEC